MFAGGTVIVALLALAVAQIPFVTSLGYACAVAVFTAVLASLTLLPAMLAILGRGVDRLALPAFMQPRPKEPDATFWARWAAMVVRHPAISCAVALVIMVPLIIPLFTLTLGQSDTGVSSTSTTQREAFDLISVGFGPGYNGALVVSVLMDPPAQPSSQYTADYDQATSMQTDLESTQQTRWLRHWWLRLLLSNPLWPSAVGGLVLGVLSQGTGRNQYRHPSRSWWQEWARWSGYQSGGQ